MSSLSQLRIESYTIPAADIGLDNPLPSCRRVGVRKVEVDDSVPIAARSYLGYGLDTGVLPYKIQDGYNRVHYNREFKVAVLENEILRAMFLLEYGGRLWSLFHKPSQQELLYRNPVFQPANLAVRNAWFSGGVEWNVGVHGHTPLTCSPMFAARVQADDGSPILRLYEWERIRQVPYQLDFSLPASSPWLLVRVRLTNPHEYPIPNYWWSNIAVPEGPDIRVLVPTDAAFNHAYQGEIRRISIPVPNDVDVTYPTNNPTASDFFFDIPQGQRPWIAALDSQGRGLLQVSTAQQRGRKLFVWGMNPGGRRWQEFLSIPDHPYMEIQAGVAQTQYECFPMQPGEELTWMEAYGLMEADARAVHGRDWYSAWQDVERRLSTLCPEPWLEQELHRSQASARRAPVEVLHQGSGWGALESRRRKRAGEPPFCTEALVFDEASLTDEQAPWLDLLDKGALPEYDAQSAPSSWMVQPEWHSMLEDAVHQGRGDHWYSWLHLGVMRYQAQQFDLAQQAWETSVSMQNSAWALRNLAVQASEAGRTQIAADLWMQAYQLSPHQVTLLGESIKSLLHVNRVSDASRLLETAPAEVRKHGRIQILAVRVALDAGELDKAEAILLGGIEVPDLREGEVMLSDLWYEIQERRIALNENISVDQALKARVRRELVPPKEIDFRMTSTAGNTTT